MEADYLRGGGRSGGDARNHDGTGEGAGGREGRGDAAVRDPGGYAGDETDELCEGESVPVCVVGICGGEKRG